MLFPADCWRRRCQAFHNLRPTKKTTVRQIQRRNMSDCCPVSTGGNRASASSPVWCSTMEPVRWLGLIRNVMVGREGLHRAVLLDLAARAGGADVRSFLTTGNVTLSW
jgi:hypothetical protein